MSDWYYAADNEQKGPINESELKAQLASNKISGDTLVWKDGMDNWTPASEVPAFSFRAAPEPAKVQPGDTLATGESDSTKPVELSDIMGKPEALKVEADDAEQNRMIGVIAYLGPLCFVTWVIGKESPFAKYHANQGCALFVVWLALCIVLYILSIFVSMLPSFLGILNAVFALVYIAPLGLTIYGIINAAAGKCVPLPFIGGLKILK